MKLGIRVKLCRNIKEIHETLSRIGIPRMADKVLWPSAHLIEVRGNYYILHFKECFLMEGSRAIVDETDIMRRNLILCMLEDWGMIEIDDDNFDDTKILDYVFVLRYKDKWKWRILPKYFPREE